jgi:hypothetical protein
LPGNISTVFLLHSDEAERRILKLGEELLFEMIFSGPTSPAIRRGATIVALGLVVLLFAPHHSAGAQRRPIQANLLQDMEFGSIVATSPTGTVTLYPTGQGPLYSGVISTGGAVAPAEFEIHGEKFLPFTIILPAAPIIIPGPTGSMVIDSFVSEPPAGANGTFNAQGKAFVTVGATMSMTDQLSAGSYNSTFDLVVTY